ncbi:hypothetical protein [Cesiribacter sp. SM1]|uniref:hypothetical protein n=1 Tax=Cesiribacter sp. SM1 TaxID=2861196 RepID=UPI001CD265E4|nr:hypothetical protein [Cesiribacter sp. SM1]
MHKKKGTGILLLMLLALAGACGSGSNETADTEQARPANKTFTFSNGEVEQILQLRWNNDTAVSFVLEHHQGACNYTLSGNAVNPYNTYEPETDTDASTGELYWVDIYLYNRDNCRMALRIAQDTSRAQLQLSNCAASPTCALESVGILRRQE